ncbi:MAG TPA: hypothetical protein VFY61_13940 [Pyrinomonadaceae bacterium]|nr:hypothetical protein [Pyrinomonadaceae bacterium]
MQIGVVVFILVGVLQGYGPPTGITRIKIGPITESSGLVASRTLPGAYWTHNDSGGGPFIYAFNTRGNSLAVFRVTEASARDWEDISIGPGPQANKPYLYIGDIGDNSGARADIVVYRVLEPDLKSANKGSTKARPLTTASAEAIRLKYPDGKYDAETLLVHPATGNLYILTKALFANPVVYEATAPLTPGKTITMKRLGEVRIPSILGGAITGGSVSPDGRRVALCDYFSGYELVLPARSKNFNDIWKEKMTGFDLGKRKQGEAIAYRLDGNALLATSEGREFDLIQVERRRSNR